VLALGIDTSTPLVSVALVSGDGLVVRREELASNKHGEVLAAFIDEVLHDAGAVAADVGAVGVGLGPGPFTGLRVGIVTAAAMSDALDIPAYGVCSLDMVDGTHDGGALVVSDARRRQLYWAAYNSDGVRQEGPEIGFPQDVAEHVRGRVTEVAGPASTLYADAFAGFRIAEPCWPDTARIAVHARSQCQSELSPEPLTPMYLRRPDAREPGPPKRVTPT
jgi:tRNA threonylcarbamoyl adenosine modification protein YeaZ